ncbi:MAG: multiprotein-bridging factor 1 family protein [Ktedonobacteraceae bacterium]
MELDDDVQIEGTVTDYLIQQITDEEHGKDFAAEYLKSVFLETTVNDLFYVRRQAGLTQAQVAEKMKTKQAAIARFEADFDGGMSLRRYVDFALACDMIPLRITLAPVELVRQYTIARPKGSGTQEDFTDWQRTVTFHLPADFADSTFHVTVNVPSSATTLKEVGSTINADPIQPQKLQVGEAAVVTVAPVEQQNQVVTLNSLTEKRAA